jgi:hypothetical protein
MNPEKEANPEAANFRGHATNDTDGLIIQSEGIADYRVRPSRPDYVNPFPGLTPGTKEHGRAVVSEQKKAYAEQRAKEKKGKTEAEEPEKSYFSEATEEVEEMTARGWANAPISALELAEKPADPEQTLLGERWLCRGGAALMVAPSGVGKSSASMQMDLCWSVGRDAFGIKPARPLRILTIQAENDPGDMHEMVTGVMRGMGFSLEEEAMIGENCRFFFEQSKTGEEFVKNVVEPLLRYGKFDLLRIDPLSAYAGADMTQADKAAALLRNSLNPLLTKYGVGLILVHHTPKVNNRDTSKWRASDWMYAGAGSADIVNWARAALVIDPCSTPGLHRFIAAKRGRRIGWEESGQQVETKWYKWAAGGIFWEPSEPEETEGKPKRTPDEVFNLVPLPPGMISKDELIGKANDYGSGKGIGINAAKILLKELIANGRVEEIEVKRSGTNAAKFIKRMGDECTFSISRGSP